MKPLSRDKFSSLSSPSARENKQLVKRVTSYRWKMLSQNTQLTKCESFYQPLPLSDHLKCVYRHTLWMQFFSCWGIWMKRSFGLYTQLLRTGCRHTQWTQKCSKFPCRERKLLTSCTETFHRRHSGPNLLLPPVSTFNLNLVVGDQTQDHIKPQWQHPAVGGLLVLAGITVMLIKVFGGARCDHIATPPSWLILAPKP